MFEFIKKSKGRKNKSKVEMPNENNQSALSTESADDTVEKIENNKQSPSNKRKLTFQEEQYLRMQKIMEEKEKAAFEEFKRGPDTTRYDVQEKGKSSFLLGITSLAQTIALLTNVCWRNPFIKYFSFAAGGFFAAALIIYLWSLIRY